MPDRYVRESDQLFSRSGELVAEWDTTTNPANPGWLVLCGGVWMPPPPERDLPQDASTPALNAMITVTRDYHGGCHV